MGFLFSFWKRTSFLAPSVRRGQHLDLGVDSQDKGGGTRFESQVCLASSRVRGGAQNQPELQFLRSSSLVGGTSKPSILVLVIASEKEDVVIEPGFWTVGLGPENFLLWGCPVQCRMLSSISGLYQPGGSCDPSCDNCKCLQISPNVFWEAVAPLVETHCAGERLGVWRMWGEGVVQGWSGAVSGKEVTLESKPNWQPLEVIPQMQGPGAAGRVCIEKERVRFQEVKTPVWLQPSEWEGLKRNEARDVGTVSHKVLDGKGAMNTSVWGESHSWKQNALA